VGDRSVKERIRCTLCNVDGVVIAAGVNWEHLDLIHDLGLISWQVLDWLSRMEEEFGVTFQPEDLRVEVFQSAASVSAFIEEKLSAGSLASRDGASALQEISGS
jgi:acyl carrier protein